jgi:hypothetical protein
MSIICLQQLTCLAVPCKHHSLHLVRMEYSVFLLLLLPFHKFQFVWTWKFSSTWLANDKRTNDMQKERVNCQDMYKRGGWQFRRIQLATLLIRTQCNYFWAAEADQKGVIVLSEKEIFSIIQFGRTPSLSGP